jgi:hypothetical protein
MLGAFNAQVRCEILPPVFPDEDVAVGVVGYLVCLAYTALLDYLINMEWLSGVPRVSNLLLCSKSTVTVLQPRE